jgi:integrase
VTRHQSCDPVPLQAVALAALERSSSGAATALLFPALNGGYLDLHNFRNRNWKSAQLAAGIDPFRRIYDLRHTFATFALRAGISTFELSRYMGRQPDDDRSSLRPPRPRRPRACN